MYKAHRPGTINSCSKVVVVAILIIRKIIVIIIVAVVVGSDALQAVLLVGLLEFLLVGPLDLLIQFHRKLFQILIQLILVVPELHKFILLLKVNQVVVFVLGPEHGTFFIFQGYVALNSKTVGIERQINDFVVIDECGGGQVGRWDKRG
ncbi:hypothetical protein BC939DRAFT_178076 [Gamsiella multidivaricata]|uniref:uncharacterized protein n=1 Tax=Gamsiella multidivaricata TaxID=101098 RepID=UPI002220055D|nr:uncharacterized protein BC939DRAFT_178076 [Gamsiella multidivaricata]KAI7822726.1 hypothetical protein BC939DRAFT_178076 [Gamsiella multidivaricata]